MPTRMHELPLPAFSTFEHLELLQCLGHQKALPALEPTHLSGLAVTIGRVFSQETQLVLLGLLAVVYGVSALARRFPHVAWLKPFRNPFGKLSPAQQAKMRRRANMHAGIELILLGVIVPMGYVVLTVMMFNDFDTVPTLLVLGASLLCIGLGITAIVRSRRD